MSLSNMHEAIQGMLRTYTEVVDYLLRTYAIDDVIDKADAAITRYTQPPAMSPRPYAETLVNKPHRCKVV